MAPNEPQTSTTSTTVFVAETRIPTSSGAYVIRAYRDVPTGTEPIAIVWGDVAGASSVPVRVHDECWTGEVLGSLKCDCRDQLNDALQHIRTHGPGAVIYLRQEGRGIGLANKIAAYAAQEQHGLDTIDANEALHLPIDSRVYEAAANIIDDLGVRSIRLITNNPRKFERIHALGVQIDERIASNSTLTDENAHYLRTKAERMGHAFPTGLLAALEPLKR